MVGPERGLKPTPTRRPRSARRTGDPWQKSKGDASGEQKTWRGVPNRHSLDINHFQLAFWVVGGEEESGRLGDNRAIPGKLRAAGVAPRRENLGWAGTWVETHAYGRASLCEATGQPVAKEKAMRAGSRELGEGRQSAIHWTLIIFQFGFWVVGGEEESAWLGDDRTIPGKLRAAGVAPRRENLGWAGTWVETHAYAQASLREANGRPVAKVKER